MHAKNCINYIICLLDNLYVWCWSAVTTFLAAIYVSQDLCSLLCSTICHNATWRLCSGRPLILEQASWASSNFYATISQVVENHSVHSWSCVVIYLWQVILKKGYINKQNVSAKSCMSNSTLLHDCKLAFPTQGKLRVNWLHVGRSDSDGKALSSDPTSYVKAKKIEVDITSYYP